MWKLALRIFVSNVIETTAKKKQQNAGISVCWHSYFVCKYLWIWIRAIKKKITDWPREFFKIVYECEKQILYAMHTTDTHNEIKFYSVTK